ncbi:MAG: hypothetical protein JRM82_01540, partial [Nitrososphaerota archaeon]|nr:hypothetical protein [Nitrososphaerota archaeon]
MALVLSSKMVVLWDMQTWIPHSAHIATACPLQTEHLAIRFTLNSRPNKRGTAASSFSKIVGAADLAGLGQFMAPFPL